MKTSKTIKTGFIGAGIVALIVVALFINPQDIYYRYKAEELIIRTAEDVVERIEGKEEEIEIEYLGGNVYSARTENNEYLIKRSEETPSNYRYDIYYEPKSLLDHSEKTQSERNQSESF